MYIGTQQIDIYLPGVRSLKEKRKYISSLKTRLGRSLNVAAAETGSQELLQRSLIGICAVSSDRETLEKVFIKIGDILKRYPQISFTGEEVQVEKKNQKD